MRPNWALWKAKVMSAGLLMKLVVLRLESLYKISDVKGVV